MLSDKKFWIGLVLGLILAMFFNPFTALKGAVTSKTTSK
jgi:hypothetical protein